MLAVLTYHPDLLPVITGALWFRVNEIAAVSGSERDVPPQVWGRVARGLRLTRQLLLRGSPSMLAKLYSWVPYLRYLVAPSRATVVSAAMAAERMAAGASARPFVMHAHAAAKLARSMQSGSSIFSPVPGSSTAPSGGWVQHI